MKFSILVPVYNVEKYLEQCIESLLNQTYKGEYEIILVDDGSTDSSGRICDKYKSEYPGKIKVIHKKNEGLVSSRDVGIENATGEYSLFVDSDDFAELNLLEEVNFCIEKNDKPDVVIYNLSYYKNGKKKKRENFITDSVDFFTEERKKEIFEALMFASTVTSLCTKAVKTQILKKDPTDYQNYYDKSMAEDLFRSIPIMTLAETVACINLPLYNYRTNDESISRSFIPDTISKKNTVYVYKRLKEYMPIWGLNDDEHILKLNARWLNEAMYTFSLYYENVKPRDRKAVVDFDWDSMMPEESAIYTSNPYENKNYRKLYTWICQKKYFRINVYFAKKNVYKKLKILKSRILK